MKLVIPLRTHSASTRAIVFFPHAGGSPRFFRHLALALPQHQVFAATYPGRDHLIDEPPMTDMHSLAANLAEELASRLDNNEMSLALVGHSLGAFVAYETAAALNTTSPARRCVVVASGQNPPHSCHNSDGLYKRSVPCSDEGIIADATRQNLNSQAVWENPELREFFLPAIRADYLLLRTYRPRPSRVNDIRVVVGNHDSEINHSLLHQWQEYAQHPIEITLVKGGHFYLESPDIQLAQFLQRLTPLTSSEEGACFHG